MNNILSNVIRASSYHIQQTGVLPPNAEPLVAQCFPILSITLPWFGYQAILVSEVMNMQMRLQKQPSAQQSQLWSVQQMSWIQSWLSTISKSGVWQTGWDGCCETLGYCSVTYLSRDDAVILRWLRIGQTWSNIVLHGQTMLLINID